MSVQRLKRVLVGRPIPTSLDQHERLSRVTGLAVFASDALSSVAYATEAILLVLVAAGTAALGASLPIAIAIAILVAIVVTSFRQSILAYPKGGGAYVVTRENLGRYPSLVAGSALLIDYVLTVAVSTAAGIDAITSAIPPLYPTGSSLCIAGVVAIAVANLRGIREAGRLFAGPTYLFVAAYLVMIGWGSVLWLRGDAAAGGRPRPAGPAWRRSPCSLRCGPSRPGAPRSPGSRPSPTAFPAFRTPEAQNARQVLAALGVILIVLFVGITFLAHAFHVVPVARGDDELPAGPPVFGLSPFYYLVQGVTALDPGPGGEHELRGLPAGRLVPGAGRLRPAPVREPRRPARVLERHPDPDRAQREPARRVPRRHPRPHPALRGRRVPVLHAQAGEHGPVLAAAPPAGLDVRRHRPEHRGRRHRARHGDHRGDEVHARRLDRGRADPGAGGRLRHRSPALRPGRPAALDRRRRHRAAADRPHRAGARRRRPSGRAPGGALRPGAVRGRARRVRRDHAGADAAGRGALGAVRGRDAARGPPLPVPLGGRAASRVPRSPPAPGARTSSSRSSCRSSSRRAGGSTCSTTRRRC